MFGRGVTASTLNSEAAAASGAGLLLQKYVGHAMKVSSERRRRLESEHDAQKLAFENDLLTVEAYISSSAARLGPNQRQQALLEVANIKTYLDGIVSSDIYAYGALNPQRLQGLLGEKGKTLVEEVRRFSGTLRELKGLCLNAQRLVKTMTTATAAQAVCVIQSMVPALDKRIAAGQSTPAVLAAAEESEELLFTILYTTGDDSAKTLLKLTDVYATELGESRPLPKGAVEAIARVNAAMGETSDDFNMACCKLWVANGAALFTSTKDMYTSIGDTIGAAAGRLGIMADEHLPSPFIDGCLLLMTLCSGLGKAIDDAVTLGGMKPKRGMELHKWLADIVQTTQALCPDSSLRAAIAAMASGLPIDQQQLSLVMLRGQGQQLQDMQALLHKYLPLLQTVHDRQEQQYAGQEQLRGMLQQWLETVESGHIPADSLPPNMVAQAQQMLLLLQGGSSGASTSRTASIVGSSRQQPATPSLASEEDLFDPFGKLSID